MFGTPFSSAMRIMAATKAMEAEAELARIRAAQYEWLAHRAFLKSLPRYATNLRKLMGLPSIGENGNE